MLPKAQVWKPADAIIEKRLHPEGSDFVSRVTSDGIKSLIVPLRASEVQEKGGAHPTHSLV